MCEWKDNKMVYYRQERFWLPDKTLELSVNPTEILALFDTDWLTREDVEEGGQDRTEDEAEVEEGVEVLPLLFRPEEVDSVYELSV